MRFLTIVITFMALFIPFTAQAQTPITDEQANNYYANCVLQAEKTEQRFSKQSQELFCACTAARLSQGVFSVEDMQIMTDTTNPNSRIALNKMIVNVYAPCMDEPTREYHYNTCVSNPQVDRLGGNKESLCRCAADKIADHLRINGARQFQDILSRNPAIVDPMQALYDDRGFQTFAQSQLLGCLQ